MNEDDLKRQRRNADIIRRMQQGETLLGNPSSTWFPERPVIKKDPKIIAALYCKDGHSWDQNKCTVCGSSFGSKPDLKSV